MIFLKLKSEKSTEKQKSECIRSIQEALAFSHKLQDQKLINSDSEGGKTFQEYRKDFMGLKQQFCSLQSTLVQACQKIQEYEEILDKEDTVGGSINNVLDEDSKS